MIENLSFEVYQEGAGWLITPGGPPVDQFGFGDREEDINQGGHSFERRESALKETNIGFVGRGGNGDGEVVNIGDDEGSGDFHLKRGHVYNKVKG